MTVSSVQSPASRDQLPTLASRVQKFHYANNFSSSDNASPNPRNESLRCNSDLLLTQQALNVYTTLVLGHIYGYVIYERLHNVVTTLVKERYFAYV